MTTKILTQSEAIAAIQAKIADPQNTALAVALSRPEQADDPYGVWVARHDRAKFAVVVGPDNRGDGIDVLLRPSTRAQISIRLVRDPVMGWHFADGQSDKQIDGLDGNLLAVANGH
ncbi:MAG: hypothetical protein DI530_17685 [Sphingomonas sp.]|jgi:hypothetical protein|uniref:hypothetical protein n=1 Tax=unclassified Sphingomonas TaxID=196159 RepID=UPI000836E9D7|nr:MULTISPECIES: hypothetical protein [unclassified Sphingomonas]PZU73095.1 MAG: hypothetical protein DI530_17685 [Sphingomonas sp.]